MNWEEEIGMTVAKNIKLYLIDHGIKQRTIADNVNMNYDKLCQSLNGKRKLDVEEFAKIVQVLGVSADNFLKKQ